MTNSQPRVSVITVCFNESKESISLTSESVISQSYGNIEWIVIDGGSKTDTIEALNAYSKHIDHFVSEPDKGIYDAMNKGLAMASGEFISFMNVGDAFCSKDTVEQMIAYALTNPSYGCYYGDAVVVDKDGNEWKDKQKRRVRRFFLRYKTICHQAVMSRRSVYNLTGDFNLNYKIVADVDWIIRSLAVGTRWIHTGLCVCRYDNTGCSSDKLQVEEERLKMAQANYSRLELSAYHYARKFIILLERITGRYI